MTDKANERARDISAPVQHISFGERSYTLCYNNMAARVAEDVYEQQYGRDVGYYDILDEMQRHKHRAIMAIVFGALVAGGAEITWEDFDRDFSITAIDAVRDRIAEGIIASLPEPEAGAEKH